MMHANCIRICDDFIGCCQYKLTRVLSIGLEHASADDLCKYNNIRNFNERIREFKLAKLSIICTRKIVDNRAKIFGSVYSRLNTGNELMRQLELNTKYIHEIERILVLRSHGFGYICDSIANSNVVISHELFWAIDLLNDVLNEEMRDSYKD